MDELFSCRNCVHNCGQSLLIGRGQGFCIKHESILVNSNRSTCKYLHRKDFPRFVVDEGLREHAAEFAGFSGIVDLVEHIPVERVQYSEKFYWEQKRFDPLNQSLAQYHKTNPAWILVRAMAGGIDGRRSLAHASLVRRYMDHCGTWQSSYRFVLEVVLELPKTPQFQDEDLNAEDEGPDEDIRQDAIWDVFFCRLSGIQEYGFHSGLQNLMWITDQMNGALMDLDWPALKAHIAQRTSDWIEQIIQHAKENGEFFPPQPMGPECT